ncbi:hypothetical protein HPB50_019930 [Hyalomma asiaticum]|uniref:Uncharacterized protein n=1 Tax=Hyalomma asiaticum TaxID=266040 RepID=A0ACB7SY70_HYAAI|nr:hypothetical protein HPB50_019930 [Hyalomma asiaticum]
MVARHDQRCITPFSVPVERALTKPAHSPRYIEGQIPYGHGKFQLLHALGAVIVMYAYSLHYDSFRLTAGVMDHWCKRPASMANLSVDEWKQLAIPTDEEGEHSHCTMRDPPDGGYAARVVPCSSWEYDLDQYGNNIVSHWNLVCNRRWLIDVARMAYAVASMALPPVVGALADSVGRKKVICLTVPVVLISGAASAVPNDFQFFVAVRTVVSASTGALVPPIYALIYEVSPIELYSVYVIAIALPSLMLSPITLFSAHLVKAGWATLQLILMVPTCLLLLLYYIIDESPSWLLETGSAKEAESISLRAASMNHVCPDHCRDLMAIQIAGMKTRSQDAGHSDGICSARYRISIVTLCYMWTAISYSFDTFVVNEGIPVGEIATAVSFAVSFIASIVAVPLARCIGFRNILVGTGLIFTLTLNALITDLRKQTVLHDSLVVLMCASGTVCFTFYFVVSIAAYPSVSRSLCAGMGLAFCRLGDTLGQMSVVLMGGDRTALKLAVAVAFMSLFVIGAELVPCNIDTRLLYEMSSSKSPGQETSADRMRAMRESLVRLPRQPVEHRGSPASKERAALSDCTTHAIREKSSKERSENQARASKRVPTRSQKKKQAARMVARHAQRSITPFSVPVERALTKPEQLPRHFEGQIPYGHGKFQLLHVLAAVIIMYAYSLHYESFRLTAGVMDHWCKRPASMANLSVEEWKQLAIPTDEQGEHSRCTMRDPPDGGYAARCRGLLVVGCATGAGSSTSPGWRNAVASMALPPVVGALGRQRRPQDGHIPNLCPAVPNDFQFFGTVRAVVSASTSALVPPIYALIYEVSPVERYSVYVIAIALSSLMLSPITLFAAHLVKAGWATLQLILMVPTCLLLLIYYIIDESPSWLLETGNVKEAESISLRAASMNHVSTDHCRDLVASQIAGMKTRSQDAGHSGGICSARYRICTVTLCYMWTAISYSFDTFVINEGVPVGEIATAVSFAVSFIANIVAVPLVRCIGFRNIVVGTGLIFTLALNVLITDLRDQTMLHDSLVVLMRASGTVCFTFYFVVSISAYPSVSRSLSAGVGLAFSRLGDTLGQMSVVLLGRDRTSLKLAVAAAFMSLFVIGAELVPCNIDARLLYEISSSKSFGQATSEDRMRAMRESLVRLPREPVKHRGSAASKERATLSDRTSHAIREKAS